MTKNKSKVNGNDKGKGTGIFGSHPCAKRLHMAGGTFCGDWLGKDEKQVSPLRFAPVEMTGL
jgi:hypothetical protein